MSTLGNIVSKVAPVLGNVLNLVLPGSSLVISGLCALFGVTNQDDLPAAIAADPQSAEKLKEFEIAHKYDLEQIQAGDRASARDMNIQTTKATGRSDYMLHFLAFFVFGLLGAYILIGYFFPGEFDKGVMHDLINIAMLPLSFYYGGMYVQARQAQLAQQNINLPPPAQIR